MSEAEINKRKREIFKRVNVRALKQWLQEDQDSESIYDLIGNDENVNIENLPRGVGANGGKKGLDKADDFGKYLLLDLRSKDEYLKFHIREAISFPHFLINQDRYIPEIYR